MSSDAFRRFQDSFLGDDPATLHAGVDVAALRALSPTEQAEAERLLLAALRDGNGRAVIGLAELGSYQAAPLLRQRLAEALPRATEPVTGGQVVALAEALWRIERQRDALDAVRRVLAQGGSWQDRREAAAALRHFRCQEAASALRATIRQESDRLVRFRAAESLFELHGRPVSASKAPPLVVAMSDADPTRRQQALAQFDEEIGNQSLPPCP